MSRRSAIVASVMMVASALGGCASTSWLWEAMSGDDLAPATSFPLVAAGNVEPAKVAMMAEDAATTGRPLEQQGFVVEDRGARQGPYKLDTGDKLRVFVYGQPNLSRLYNVDQSGNISIPLIGNIRARGTTTQGLEGAIRGRLAQSLVRDPQVTVDVQQNRPFFILGEVRQAGQFAYVTGMTVEMAVAIAGGYGERANERKARLSRRNGGFTDVIDVPMDAELEPGDTVYVYERFF